MLLKLITRIMVIVVIIYYDKYLQIHIIIILCKYIGIINTSVLCITYIIIYNVSKGNYSERRVQVTCKNVIISYYLNLSLVSPC